MKILSLLSLLLMPASQSQDNCGAPAGDVGLSSDLQVAVNTATPGRGNGRVPKVYHGTERPTHVPLTDGQIMAVGSWETCSGTVIADRWVLTANHCRIYEGQQFCIGQDADDPIACLQAQVIHRNPDADMTLVYLSGSATEAAAGLQPIPLFDGDLDDDWIGVKAEAAGYGQQEDGGYGEREFTAEPIVDLDGHELTVDGEGERGVCFGDSGGPVMVIDSEGTVGVAGALSWGDPDCLGRDRYTRVDTNRDWLEGILGPLDELDMGGTPPVSDAEPEPEEELPDYTTGEGWWEPIEWR
jgi:hypothetical protein